MKETVQEYSARIMSLSSGKDPIEVALRCSQIERLAAERKGARATFDR